MPATHTDSRPDVIAALEGVGSSFTGHVHRPVLEIEDLDAHSEWNAGREALMALVTELKARSTGSDLLGAQPAQWIHAGVLISVQLVYGAPVVVFERGCGRASIPLAQADLEELRGRSSSLSKAA